MRQARTPSSRTDPGRGSALGAFLALAFLGATLGPGGARDAFAQTPASARATATAVSELPRVGPANGTLVVAGGGVLAPEIWERFVALAGGAAAEIVVIPTAAEEDEFPSSWDVLESLRRAGATRVTLLHTRDRATANTDAFVAPLRTATGVWMPGGRQHRLAEAYLHTRVHEELDALLARDGVIGGTSAGASIQASFLVRGDPETNTVVLSRAYMEGFGFLRGAAVDQHLLARNRADDLWLVLDFRPDLLGIGLDEGTAVVVRGDRAEVIGRSEAIFYDATGPRRTTVVLRSGGVFDLGGRERLIQ